MSASLQEISFVLARQKRRWRSLVPVRRVLGVVREWRRRARSRAAMATLGDRMLRDIGISRCDAWREINKPFWRE